MDPADERSGPPPGQPAAVPAAEASTAPSGATPQLKRQVGLVGAVFLGLGAMVGTGLFVSTSIAAAATGPAVLLAIAVAAALATCNGLSSAQLAAAYPVSGGTYEYGYRCLTPALGFTAGWLFLCAKTASAATAALGIAAAVLQALDIDQQRWLVPGAWGAAGIVTLLVLLGMRRSNHANVVIVSVTLAALVAFVAAGWSAATEHAAENLQPFFAGATPGERWAGFAQACALMFVAYTGYGRVATLGEEIHEPQKNIPRAVIATLAVTMLLYLAVTWVAVAAAGAQPFATAGTREAAPLQTIAEGFAWPGAAYAIAVGAVTAMAGVLLNLVLGLSRIVLAMGRRRDLPPVFATVNRAGDTPVPAVLLVGLGIAALATLGDVKTAWSFSAFTVLLYYALTNLAAIRMPVPLRRYPRWIPWVGLAGCLALAFWVEMAVWLTGLAVVAAGLVWYAAMRAIYGRV